MVLTIILSTIIIIVLILFELNLIVEYLLGLHLKTTHRRVPIGQMKFMTVFNIENIFFINETEWIINNQEKTRKNSRLKSVIAMEQLSCNINCDTTDREESHVTRAHVPFF